jgi:hypothetical protein
MADKETITRPLHCGNVTAVLNEQLAAHCRSKRHHLRPCSDQDHRGCSCGGAAGGDGKCEEIKYPDVEPCVSISWGDSDCDCLETDDVEILCITICNCYSNVTFENVVLGTVVVTDATGKPVPNLPDGTPSVQAIPLGPICFGNIGPCKDGQAACVSRQFALWTRGARGGIYQVHVGPICFKVCYAYEKQKCFLLPLCQD